METLGAPHVQSFNYFLECGMQNILKAIEPYQFELNNGEKIKVNIDSCEITPPRVNAQIDLKERRIFPCEARQRSVTYAGNCTMTLGWSKNDVRMVPIDFDLGPIPVMVRVSINLKFLNQLISIYSLSV